MTAYRAPLDDMMFAATELAGLESLARLPAFAEATPDLVAAALEEAGKIGANVLAPLNEIGDRQHSVLENGQVRTPEGFKAAWTQFRDGGWGSLPFEPDYGGQGLPWLVAVAVQEIIGASNMAFSLCPLLTQGTVELLSAHGSPEQKALYLPKLISGEWTGTMNLTEPQAGSDLAQVRAKAVKDGHAWKITGQKIFITYGEHDMADNIVHFVLARAPDAPAGVKGISLFIVPKFLPDVAGKPGARNDLRCVSLERKLGINASPTAIMAFGDNGGATGYLVGEANRGLEYMFTMMNNARLAVGVQGVAIAEAAYQHALAYAKERVQSKPVTRPEGGPATIIHHPDVRRMLMTMKARAEAARGLAYYTAAAIDSARHHPDAASRRQFQSVVDLLIPVVKGWCSEAGIANADLGIQIHGGMGFIEESGAPQFWRDARITAIYEGTNGIQANDLVGRKVARDNGASATAFIAHMRATLAELERAPGESLAVIGRALKDALTALSETTDWILETHGRDPAATAAGSKAYLDLWGISAGGWQMARAALAATSALGANRGHPKFLSAKLATARLFAEQILVKARAYQAMAMAGAQAVMALDEDQF
ncbi:MAG: acyl-CoA dehydrogenase [Rhodospirillales bacterium]|nr:acyl-CoA dehydrogenase [Rhodospirillales bacterium]